MFNRPHFNRSIFDKVISRFTVSMGFFVLLLVLATQPVSAAKTLNDAVRKAKTNSNGKVISARTVEKNNRRTHEVRVLTNKGKVKTMRYPAGASKQNKANKNHNKKNK